MDNNTLSPGTVLVGGYDQDKKVVVSLPGQPPGSVAVYTPALNCVTVYCDPNKYEFEAVENGAELFDAMEEFALFAIEQSQRVIDFARAMRAGNTSVELPMGVQVFYKDVPDYVPVRHLVNVEFAQPVE